MIAAHLGVVSCISVTTTRWYPTRCLTLYLWIETPGPVIPNCTPCKRVRLTTRFNLNLRGWHRLVFYFPLGDLAARVYQWKTRPSKWCGDDVSNKNLNYCKQLGRATTSAELILYVLPFLSCSGLWFWRWNRVVFIWLLITMPMI